MTITSTDLGKEAIQVGGIMFKMGWWDKKNGATVLIAWNPQKGACGSYEPQDNKRNVYYFLERDRASGYDLASMQRMPHVDLENLASEIKSGKYSRSPFEKQSGCKTRPALL